MRAKSTRSYGEPVFAWLAALLLYFQRFGYDYGHSDQGEFLPVLLHRLLPDVLMNDWFVQTQEIGFNVRYLFTLLLEGPSRVISLEWVVFLAFVFAFTLLASAIYALARRLTRDRLVAVLTVILALVLTPQWTLGGNDLVHRMLVPSMFGWGCGLWAVYLYLRRWFLRAGLLLGLACWMQPLVALQLGLITGTILLLEVFIAERRPALPGNVVRYAGAFLVAGAPMLGPLLYQQLWLTAPPPPPDTPTLPYILMAFRAPHHYLPDTFSSGSVLRFGLLFGIGLLAYSIPVCKKSLRHTTFITGTLFLVTILCLVSYWFTEFRPVFFISKLQLFKLTVFLKLLLLIILSGAFSIWLPTHLWRRASKLMATQWPVFFVLGGWLFVAVSFFPGPSPFLRKWQPAVHAQSPLADLERWAREQTESDALFAVPPSFSGFRTRAQRAIVVDFKAMPFDAADTYEWFTRLRAVAPISLPRRGGARILRELDEAFEGQPPAALAALARTYGVTYVVRDRSLPPSPDFVEVFRNEDWIVYRFHGDRRGAV